MSFAGADRAANDRGALPSARPPRKSLRRGTANRVSARERERRQCAAAHREKVEAPNGSSRRAERLTPAAPPNRAPRADLYRPNFQPASDRSLPRVTSRSEGRASEEERERGCLKAHGG